jgi:Ribose/xylose/arabinose/galactoside ABC-type transport systems, permease components
VSTATTTPTESAGEDERLLRTNPVVRALRRPEIGSLLGAVLVWIMFASADSSSNHLWLNQTGVAAWTQQAAFFGIMAIPVALLMIGGEFDLSTGVLTGATAIFMGLLVGKWGLNAWLAILLTFAASALVGLFNGYVVVRTKLPSFIVTLATFFILRGLTVGGVLLLNHGSTNIGLPPGPHSGMSSANTLFGSSFLKSSSLPNGYQTAILWFIGVTAVGAWLLAKTRFGNWIYAVGGDANAARNVGVPVTRTKILLFVGTSMCAGLVGVISFTQAGSAVSEQGVGYEFYYIIAAVVGGCLLTGGYGSAIGAALGACVIGMAFEGVIYAGWDSSWDFTFLGVILFLAVAVNTLIYQRANKSR